MSLRILFIGINRKYVNPITDIILSSISYLSYIDNFGPGFVTEKELNLGIEKWIEKKGGYDLYITDTMIFESNSLINKKYLFENEAINFKKKLYYKHSNKLRSFFLNLNSTKILIANFDYYIVSKKQIDIIINDSNLLVISNVDFNTSYSVKKTNKLGNELIDNILNEYPDRNSNWHNLITNYKNKIISLPNAVYSNKINYTPIEYRRNRYTVPGFPYTERVRARKLYNLKEKLNHHYIEFLFFKEKISRKLYFPRPFNWDVIQSDRLFNRIKNSKMCFTSGAVTRTPIAKYFEIPAGGSVLICQKFAGFKHFGFADGINCFVAENFKDIKYILKNYDSVKYQKIANNGRNLIKDFHSDYARMNQINLVLQRINKNNFNGSYWENGKYFLKD